LRRRPPRRARPAALAQPWPQRGRAMNSAPVLRLWMNSRSGSRSPGPSSAGRPIAGDHPSARSRAPAPGDRPRAAASGPPSSPRPGSRRPVHEAKRRARRRLAVRHVAVGRPAGSARRPCRQVVEDEAGVCTISIAQRPAARLRVAAGLGHQERQDRPQALGGAKSCPRPRPPRRARPRNVSGGAPPPPAGGVLEGLSRASNSDRGGGVHARPAI